MRIITVNADLLSLTVELFEVVAKNKIKVILKCSAINLNVANPVLQIDWLDVKSEKIAKTELIKLVHKTKCELMYLDALKQIIAHPDLSISSINYVINKIAYGEIEFDGIVLLHEKTLDKIGELSKAWTLDNSINLLVARYLFGVLPKVKHYACFDTTFHKTQLVVNQIYPIDYRYYEDGVRKYGVDGLSCEYIISKLANYVDHSKLKGRYVIANISSLSSSICAIHKLKSVATTSRLVGATSVADLDSSVVFSLQSRCSLQSSEMQDILSNKSGLLGVSGISGELDILLKSDESRAKLAVDYLVNEVAANIAKLAGYLGGIDGIVFTASVGERNFYIREHICNRLAFLGIEIKHKDNKENKSIISKKSSKVRVMVIPTNENFAMLMQLLQRVQ